MGNPLGGWGPLDTRRALKRIGRNLRHKRSLGAPSNVEDYDLFLPKPPFSHFCPVRGFYMGSPPGPPLEPRSATNRKKGIPKSTLKNIVRKVLQKRSLGILSNLDNYGLVERNQRFRVQLDLQNNRKWCPMGTPLGPLWVLLDAVGHHFA